MKISIIIPTYNRKDILFKCLNALFNQTHPKSQYEIIVVDDGSTDTTPKLVKKLTNLSPVPLNYFKQANKGPASVRNLGIMEAKGDIILFIGDDIIATPHLIEEHVKWHTENFPEDNVAVLGYVTWSPEIEITPLMYWLEHGGPQWSFDELEEEEIVNFHRFITANISLKRNFLLNNGLFDQDFPYAAYEDTELGYRLEKKGLKIVYNKKAVGFHYHPTDIYDFANRMKKMGESVTIFCNKHPELKKVHLTQFLWLPPWKYSNFWKLCKHLFKKLVATAIVNKFTVHLLLKFIEKMDKYNIKRLRINKYLYLLILYHFYCKGIGTRFARLWTQK